MRFALAINRFIELPLRILCVVSLSLLSILGVPILRAEEEPSIKVGVILSFSGGLEQWCGYIRQGIELAQSDESPVKLKIIYEDDHSVDKKAALSAAQKLLHTDKVDLLVSWTASTVPVLGPASSKAHTPLLIGAHDHNVEKGGPYVFGAFVNYELVPRDIASFFVKTKGVKRLGIIMAADDWSQSFEKPFRDEVEKLGGKVLLSEIVSPTDTDLGPLILRLKEKRIEAVLSPLYSSSLYSFIKKARELNFPGIIHVGDGMFEEDLKIVGPSAAGVYASQIWLESNVLADAFKKRFGDGLNPLQLGLAATGYDWVKHVQGAGSKILKDGKHISRETLREALGTFSSQGYLGEQMYGKPPVKSGEIIMMVKDERFVLPES